MSGPLFVGRQRWCWTTSWRCWLASPVRCRATALVQARACGAFTTAHEAFWAAARRQHGDSAGTRELVEVLLLHRHLTAGQVVAGIEAALSVGAARADVVAVEARRTADTGDRKPVDPEDLDSGSWPSGVVSLTERRLADPASVIAGLPADTRAAPRVDPYDQLLTRRIPTTAATAAACAEGEVS